MNNPEYIMYGEYCKVRFNSCGYIWFLCDGFAFKSKAMAEHFYHVISAS